MLAIVLITIGVYAWAILGEGYALKRLGFGQCSWVTPLLAIALTAFFVLVFGPIASWVLARSGSQGQGKDILAPQVHHRHDAARDDRGSSWRPPPHRYVGEAEGDDGNASVPESKRSANSLPLISY